MANIAVPVVQNMRAAIWDGTNSADLLATAMEINPSYQWEIVSETEDQLVLGYNETYGYLTIPLDIGGGIVWLSNIVRTVVPSGEMQAEYRVAP
jgi:hypothetical protein